MGFLELLTIVFITLKLIGEISWPWLWVLAPLWIGYGVGIAVLLLILMIVFLAKVFSQ